MKLYKNLIFILSFFPFFLISCQDEPDYKNTLYGNFDALADIIDKKYCFFREKDLDWDAITRKYREQISDTMNVLQLFDLCSAMLDELQDGHVNLSSYFSTSYYRKWWSDYPQDFNLRTLQEYYLDFDYYQTSGISYKVLDGNVGYMYYPSFSSGIGPLNLDYILAILYSTDALIIDIRDNGGGLLTNVDVLVSRFITHEITGGYVVHKTGPGHDDFSEPYEYKYQPAEAYRISWPVEKPVYVLTNRSCFSAANDFVSVMKTLPNVKIVGARTGGGAGLPFSSELPIGWSIRFSASPMYSPDMVLTEFGIDPSEGCEVHCTDEELAVGRDAILDFALDLAKTESGNSQN